MKCCKEAKQRRDHERKDYSFWFSQENLNRKAETYNHPLSRITT